MSASKRMALRWPRTGAPPANLLGAIRLTEAEFLDLLGAASLIPGPSSTELAIFIGHHGL